MFKKIIKSCLEEEEENIVEFFVFWTYVFIYLFVYWVIYVGWLVLIYLVLYIILNMDDKSRDWYYFCLKDFMV